LFVVESLSPGETISVSGVYRVVHSEHRADHDVLALKGDVLPDCRVCKNLVRFHLEHSIDYAPHDWDLAGPLINFKAASKAK
jgi:hypothetical protein